MNSWFDVAFTPAKEEEEVGVWPITSAARLETYFIMATGGGGDGSVCVCLPAPSCAGGHCFMCVSVWL